MLYFVKSYFNGWCEVDKDHFDSFCQNIRENSTAISSDKIDNYIASKTIVTSYDDIYFRINDLHSRALRSDVILHLNDVDRDVSFPEYIDWYNRVLTRMFQGRITRVEALLYYYNNLVIVR